MRRIESGGRGDALFALPGSEQVFQGLAERLDLGEVYRPRRALEVVGGAEHGRDEIALRVGRRRFLQGQQARRDGLQVFRGLDLEGRSQRVEEFVFLGAHGAASVTLCISRPSA